MLDERDQQEYEESEDGEYHFSDDEMDFDAEESEAATKPQPAKKSSTPILASLSSSKRMLISIVAFFVLVFIAYKMIAPTTSTDINTTNITPAPTEVPPAAIAGEQPALVPTTNIKPVITVKETPRPVKEEPTLQIVAQANQANKERQATTPTVTESPIAAPPVATPPTSVSVPSSPPPTTTATPAPTPEKPLIDMPSVIPVTSPPYSYPAQNPPSHVTVVPAANEPASQSTNTAPVPTTPPAPNNAQVLQAITQMQTDMSQRSAEYDNQQKATAAQMQALNNRVASLETQLSQLVQALTRQTQAQTQAEAAAAKPESAASADARANDLRISYNVQAIIPGRAWLRRADSGETLTVAEGDVIKGVGRVTKIDPYDGVVEINTGTKVISLSYGSEN